MTTALRDQLAAAQIRREDGKSGSRYVLAADGAEAEMTFSRVSPHLVIIDHTEVPDAFRGMGAGLRLAGFAVADAREGGWKITPLCPFFHAQADCHLAWADVIKAR